MRIIKCDKCGNEINCPNYHRDYIIYHMDKNSYDDSRTYVDLCENCYGEVELWLNTDAHIKVAPVDDNHVPYEPMSVRRILEKFENWYVEYSKCYGSSMDFARYRLMTNGTYAVDKYIEKLKKNE